MGQRLFTSESVSEGHPDKVADQISDRVLDACLAQDPQSRVACEAMISTGFVMVSGEITTKASLNFEDIIRDQIKKIGYDDSHKGFDFKTCKIHVSVGQQSPDIAKSVNQEETGAGDQGLMFGYATNETHQFMPLSIQLSHKLMLALTGLRKSSKGDFLYPDSKAQVTVEYDGDKIQRIDTIVISTQHSPEIKQSDLHDFLREELLKKVLPAKLVDNKTKIFLNPAGAFTVGGPEGDCGLTGRKIIVDTYGGHGSHGGGAFSGKDPTKVDRSGAYIARHITKNIVAAGLAKRCLIQLSYAIGVPEPLSVYVEDYGTSPYSTETLSKAIRELWRCQPKYIISRFDLLNPIYTKTAAYGHFGRSDVEFSWEKLDQVSSLKDIVKTLAS